MLGHPAPRMIAHPDMVVAEFQFFAIIRAQLIALARHMQPDLAGVGRPDPRRAA